MDLLEPGPDAAPGENPPELSEQQEEFLRLIAEHGTTDGAAIAAVGLSRWTATRWKKDSSFLERYKAARKVGLEQLEEEAKRRAMNGSDRLLEFLLINSAPEKYSARHKVEHQGDVSLTVLTGVPIDDDASDLAG